MFGGLEKTCGEIHWQFGGNVFGDLENTYSAIFSENLSAFWRNRSAILEKTCSANTLEIWRIMVGVVMAISYWSSLWSSLELSDRKWRLNHNGEIMETNY